MRAPIGSLADLALAVLERGLVLAIRLEGPPGDRRLLMGLGLAGATDPLLMALCASGVVRHQRAAYVEDDLGHHVDDVEPDFDDFDWHE